jgi:signal peptidase I
MEDEIPKDSYILIKRTDPSEIRKDDIICFYSDDFTIQGYPNTHRVVEDPIITENGIEYVTRGDANPINDSATAKGEKLIGKHVKNLDGVTKFAHALEGNTMIIIIGVILMASVVMITYTAVLESKKEATKKD